MLKLSSARRSTRGTLSTRRSSPSAAWTMLITWWSMSGRRCTRIARSLGAWIIRSWARLALLRFLSSLWRSRSSSSFSSELSFNN